MRTKNLETGEEGELKYDKLVMATGATPRRLHFSRRGSGGRALCVQPPRRGADPRGPWTKGEVSRAVIVGAGFIGLEMAEAFADMWDVDTTVLEISNQVMPRYLSPVLAKMAMRHMQEKGVTFCLGESIQRIEGDGRVKRV